MGLRDASASKKIHVRTDANVWALKAPRCRTAGSQRAAVTKARGKSGSLSLYFSFKPSFGPRPYWALICKTSGIGQGREERRAQFNYNTPLLLYFVVASYFVLIKYSLPWLPNHKSEKKQKVLSQQVQVVELKLHCLWSSFSPKYFSFRAIGSDV